MSTQINEAIKQRLEKSDKVLITSHVRPDGDAVGALLGLGLALENAGKSVQMVLVDGLPPSFMHLPGSDRVRTRPADGFDAYVTVDSADLKRLGEAMQPCGKPHINVDHHVTNERFAELNLIEPDSVATCAMLTDHLPAWGYALTRPVAAALATGIITDTLGFRTSNMKPATMRQMAVLMETGIDMPGLYRRALVSRTFEAARYWGAGLSSLERSDGIVWGTLRLSDRRTSGYPRNDDSDLINVISSIDCCAVGMVFVEQEGGSVKVSWRAMESGLDVSQVARRFGGGGHQAAAGADIPGKIEEVQPLVLETTQRMLKLG
ncbi:MAG: DHH family phosphoesterase [Chloroflexota bacterium]